MNNEEIKKAIAEYNKGNPYPIMNCGYSQLVEYINQINANCNYYAKCNLKILEREAKQIRQDTAKEVLQRVVNICKNEEDFQDRTVNKQPELLHFGILNGCSYVRREAKELAAEYGVEVDDE